MTSRAAIYTGLALLMVVGVVVFFWLQSYDPNAVPTFGRSVHG